MIRSRCFDVLKGIAIFAVVLYHLGICRYGYLGVDVFLVVAGFFTMQSIDKQILNSNQWYVSFIINRLFRLLPLLLIASLFCLLHGLLFMLPDDFENLSQSIFATNFFANNILQCITTKDYWNVVNEYKPLMHTWYVGLIMQFYIVMPLIYFIIGNNSNKPRKLIIFVNVLIGIISLLMYLFIGSTAEKFYYLPFRLFEFCFGSLIFHWLQYSKIVNCYINNLLLGTVYLLLITLLFINVDFISNVTRLLLIVFATCYLLYALPQNHWTNNKLFSNKWIAIAGVSSFSIFIWHQIIFAITRYSFTNNLTDINVLIPISFIIIILTYLSYKYVETIKNTKEIRLGISILFIFTSMVSLWIYNNAGIVRDVPELDVIKGNAKRGMWAEYCDRGYQYDKEFMSNDKPHWFVIGNSFGRDMVNIIVESEISENVEISYSDLQHYREHIKRFNDADIVFLSTLRLNKELIEDVKRLCTKKCKFFIIGEKNFGENNGQIYMHRFESNFHQMTIHMEDGYSEKNKKIKSLYPNCYIDMIELVSMPDGKVKVFSDDGRFISQDCRHLTKAGAQYYAKLIDWSYFMKLN